LGFRPHNGCSGFDPSGEIPREGDFCRPGGCAPDTAKTFLWDRA
jgi:hypothetical protein